MKNFFSRLVNILLVLIVLFAALVTVVVSISKQQGKAPTLFGYSFMAVQTGSMVPTYHVGTVIVVRSCEPSELNKGDVISFYSSDPSLHGIVVTHRIVEVNENDGSAYSFVTQGDANPVEDKYEAAGENVVGKVVGTSTALAKVTKLRQNPQIFIFVIVIPMCAIIMFEFLGISKKIKSGGNKNEKAEGDNEQGKQ